MNFVRLTLSACLLFVLALSPHIHADHLEVRRSATLKVEPQRNASIRSRVEPGEFLSLINDGTQTNGYYFARRLSDGSTGWIYRTLVRRHEGPAPQQVEIPVAGTALETDPDLGYLVCSFNIQFLGMFARRDHRALANVLRPCDVAVIQELVAPPRDGTYSDGTPYRPDPESDEFFSEMETLGFAFELSRDDTGTGDENQNNGSATEWWVTFYRDERLTIADDLPNGFIADDLTNHPSYERVPYAISFRSGDGLLDFVVISVHLQPNAGSAARARREEELEGIANWIADQPGSEGDYIIVGDMNFQNCGELNNAMPQGFASLNAQCFQTNTNQRPGSERPYDHVLYAPATSSSEIDLTFGFRVVNLLDEMRDDWELLGSNEAYPGQPYDHNRFRQIYSDHHPVAFRIRADFQGDDD